jgi:enterobactin synthetase component D
MKPFRIAFQHATPHGVLVATWIPNSPDPVPDDVLDRLPPAEAARARELRGYRQPQFVGGRIALREAFRQIDVRLPPILSTDRGAPLVPAGLAGSISHKGNLAVGMASRADGDTLGVDLEDYGPARMGIASRILRAEELEEVQALPASRQWIAVLQRFSIKESVYKALDPYVHRYVAFHEASVSLDLSGGARVELHLEGEDKAFDVDARYAWLQGRLFTSVRIRPQ